jgi:hypothetical protein
MNATILLRVASVAAAIQGLAHGTLLWTYTPRHGPVERTVVEAMRTNYFSFGGASRSYWDFYFGYAMMVAFICLVEAALFWQLSRFAGKSPAVIPAVAGVFIFFNVVHALMAARYFFFLPIVFDLLLVALLGAAAVTSARAII